MFRKSVRVQPQPQPQQIVNNPRPAPAPTSNLQYTEYTGQKTCSFNMGPTMQNQAVPPNPQFQTRLSQQAKY